MCNERDQSFWLVFMWNEIPRKELKYLIHSMKLYSEKNLFSVNWTKAEKSDE